jgi:hypothetical protein
MAAQMSLHSRISLWVVDWSSFFHCPTGLLAGVTFVLTFSQYSKTC